MFRCIHRRGIGSQLAGWLAAACFCFHAGGPLLALLVTASDRCHSMEVIRHDGISEVRVVHSPRSVAEAGRSECGPHCREKPAEPDHVFRIQPTDSGEERVATDDPLAIGEPWQVRPVGDGNWMRLRAWHWTERDLPCPPARWRGEVMRV